MTRTGRVPVVARVLQVLDALYGRTRTRQTTQGEIGETLGVSGQAVGRWLRGEGQPAPDTLTTLCERYDVSPLWLLLDEGPEALSALREDLVAGARARAAAETAQETDGDPPRGGAARRKRPG